jgi:hypothetical protein
MIPLTGVEFGAMTYPLETAPGFKIEPDEEIEDLLETGAVKLTWVEGMFSASGSLSRPDLMVTQSLMVMEQLGSATRWRDFGRVVLSTSLSTKASGQN